MSELITLINYIAVSIFGSILSAAFCGIGKEKLFLLLEWLL